MVDNAGPDVTISRRSGLDPLLLVSVNITPAFRPPGGNHLSRLKTHDLTKLARALHFNRHQLARFRGPAIPAEITGE